MKVSVEMITYNHEQFIAQAIDSVLMQKTSFEYELVIGEDCSTDRTRDIVIEYHRKHPDKIRLLLPERNLGVRENARQTREACQGEYIAVLEGDDYWTSPHKLQQQVDFLDAHSECATCFHNVVAFYEDGSQEPRNYCPPDQKEISTLQDLLLSDFIPNCSVMFRSGLVGERPDWCDTLPMGDWPHHILVAQHGNIGYIDEVMGAYRIHPGGVWSSRDTASRMQADIQLGECVNAHLNFRYENIIGSMVANRWDWLAAALVEQEAKQGSVWVALSSVLQIFDQWAIQSSLSEAWKARSLSRIYAGALFASYKACDIRTTRYCLVKAVRYDPSLLRNWGVWSIAVEVFLGQQAASWARRQARVVW